MVNYRKHKTDHCFDCNTDDIRILCVHHNDHNRENNNLDNLITLCYNCHRIRHYEKKPPCECKYQGSTQIVNNCRIHDFEIDEDESDAPHYNDPDALELYPENCECDACKVYRLKEKMGKLSRKERYHISEFHKDIKRIPDIFKPIFYHLFNEMKGK